MRKAFVLGAGLGLLALLLFGRSHVLTTVGLIKTTVKDSMPVEYEIKRARQMITDLGPEIRQNMHLIAKEEVEVAKLQDELNRSEERLAKAKQDILRLRGDLERGESVYVYVGHQYTAQQVKNDLERRWEKYQVQESTVEKLRGILQAREAGLRAAQDKLKAMIAAKEQLEVDVENLEARLKMVEVAQTNSQFNFDDSQLSRTRELVEDIGTRIEVAERMVNADTDITGEIPLEEPTSENILDEIAKHFGVESQAENFVKLEP